MSQHTFANFFSHFDNLSEPRVDRTKLHKLMDVVFIAVCALLSGANDFVGMEKFGKTKIDWLKKYLELPNGIPSHDTFGRVIQAIDPQQFVNCFRSWVAAFADTKAGRLIAIDGKTARASLDRKADQNPLHVVSAWAQESRLLLGQLAVDEKSNEITAIPTLLEILELEGAVVTIDAMGCQTEIVAKIREKKADYILAAKGNQDHLEEDVIAEFAKLDEPEGRGQPSQTPDVYETKKEKGHGREEQRCCEALPVPSTLRNKDKWKDIKSICRVTRIYTERGEEKSEVRYFISSLPAKAKKLALGVRGHWGIENGLHWVLDMAFSEDRSRARKGHAQENLALLRRWMISLLRQDTTIPGGIEKKRLQAGWNVKNLETLLGLF
jgi:predicted transposase YbfD/YdcC